SGHSDSTISIAGPNSIIACAVRPSGPGRWTPTLAPNTSTRKSISAAASRQTRRGMIGEAPAGTPGVMVSAIVIAPVRGCDTFVLRRFFAIELPSYAGRMIVRIGGADREPVCLRLRASGGRRSRRPAMCLDADLSLSAGHIDL